MPLSKEKQKIYNRLYYLKKKKLSATKTQPAGLKIASTSRLNSNSKPSNLQTSNPTYSSLQPFKPRPRGFIQTVTPWLGCFVYAVLTVALISFLVIF